MDNVTGFFSSFNARHMDAEQIAKAFVPSPRFMQLLSLQNTLLVGARGSGKTHMLKMLQPKALNVWEHEAADTVRASINYWGVFVPADEAWRQQVDAVAGGISEALQDKYKSAVFTTHVQRSLVDCFLQLTYDPSTVNRFGKVSLEVSKEYELCQTLAESWGLTPRIFSIVGIRQSLVDRLGRLYEAVDLPDSISALLENCQTHAVSAISQGTFAFDAAIERFEGRWCIMFDELEIAPAEVQRLLFRSLRSTDQKLIFKLALSPSSQAASIFNEVLGPSPGNDFDEISLYSEPREAQIFCESLWEKIATGTDAQHLKPSAILGHSVFHEPETDKPYERNGRWQRASSSLAKKDPSYVAFLKRYEIDPFNLDSALPEQRSAVIRKIGPIVGFRDFMYKIDGRGNTHPRADKAKPAQIFSGWEALCLVTEGNPRWFTGIAKTLLIKRASSVSGRELTRELQYSCLQSASKKFMGYLATIPRPTIVNATHPELGLKGLIDLLVERFRDEVLKKDFVLDPVLSFSVDDVDSDIRQSLIDGLYAGAFIPIGDTTHRKFTFSGDLKGQRFRITYLLAPQEILPLRTGKDRKLSTLIGGKEKHPKRQALIASADQALQITLFKD